MTGNFHKDLLIGKVYESYTRHYVSFGKDPLITYAPNSKFKDWDVKAECNNGRVITVEVKADLKADDNLAIEFKCNGEDSGITTTKAEFWLHFCPKTSEVFKFRTDKLRKLVCNVTIPEFGVPPIPKIYCGNGNMAQCYLIPKAYFHKINLFECSKNAWKSRYDDAIKAKIDAIKSQ